MAKKTTRTDVCIICKETRTINFEHIPPKSCGNSETRYYEANLVDVINKKKLDSDKVKKFQGGTGKYSICIECNHKFGKEYVNAYKQMYQQAVSLLKINANKLIPVVYKFDIYPLQVFKEICVMFVALNSHETFPNEIYDFILDKESNIFPSNIKVYMSYYVNRQPSILPFASLVNAYNLDKFSWFSEIMFHPFGLLMTIDSDNHNKEMVDITHLSQYKYDEKALLDLKLKVTKSPSIFIGNYINKER